MGDNRVEGAIYTAVACRAWIADAAITMDHFLGKLDGESVSGSSSDDCNGVVEFEFELGAADLERREGGEGIADIGGKRRLLRRAYSARRKGGACLGKPGMNVWAVIDNGGVKAV